MTGIHRQIGASLGLALLIAFVSGCATTPPWAPRVAEVIPPQTCGGDIDSDGDGITECNDRCPGTLRGEQVDPDGCPLPRLEPKPYRG